MCNKIGYLTKQAAVSDYHLMRKMDKKYKSRNNQGMTPYDCGFCDYWHLTSQKKNRKEFRN